MGTRHLIQVIVDGKVKIAQYGQWDGYPTGQGKGIAEFLHTADLDAFADAARQTHFISDEENRAIKEEYAPGADGWFSKDQADRLAKDYPELVRDTGSDILGLVLNGKRGLQDNSDFIDDTLYCEWAYIINLDTREVTVIFGYPKRYPPRVYPFAEFTVEAMAQLEAADEDNE